MQMKGWKTVYLRVKDSGEDGEPHLANNAKYWILEQI